MSATLTTRPRTEPHPDRWRALGVSQIAAFMALLDVSIVNVALPSIERGLHVSAAHAQWVISGYALAMGLTLVPAGRLGDIVGRRRMFLIALSAFVLSSALSGMAPTAVFLIAARLLQGAAAGALIPQNSGLVQELFSGPERGRAFGILGATVGVATAAGPVVGGLILAAFPGPEAWRWVFFVNVPIGVVALALVRRYVPAVSRQGRPRADLDIVGALLLGGAVLSLLLPIVYAQTGAMRRLTWLFGVAAVLAAAFVWWESRCVRRGRQPLLDPHLVRIPGFGAGSTIGLVYFLGFTGVSLVLALFFQDGLGYTPLRSGLTVTPFALGVAASAVVAGRLVSRVGRWLTVAGLSTCIVGFGVTALVLRVVSGDAAAWAVAAPLLLAGVGGGMVTSPNITLTLHDVPVSMAGAAGGALQTAQRIGGAIGAAVLATTFYQRLADDGGRYPSAISGALLDACCFMALALVVAIVDLARHPSPQGARTPTVADPAHPMS